MVHVNELIEGMYVTVDLVEYPLSGMIILQNLSRKRRHRSIRSVIPFDKTVPAEVLEVDEIRDTISLSRRHLDEEIKTNANNRYKMNSKLKSIITRYAEISGEDFNRLWESVVHVLDTYIGNKKESLTIFEYLQANYKTNIFDILPSEIKTYLITAFNKLDKLTSYKIMSVFGLISPDSFIIVKNTLTDIKSEYPDANIKIQSIPFFIIETTTADVELSINYQQEILNKIKIKAKSNGAFFKLKQEPVVC